VQLIRREIERRSVTPTLGRGLQCKLTALHGEAGADRGRG
jgi:hypothetical protein